jgi:hypothetical protein
VQPIKNAFTGLGTDRDRAAGMKTFSILFISAVLATVGCKGKDDGGTAASKTADKGADKAAAGGPIKLAKLGGLQIDVAGGAEVGDGVGGDGVMLTATSIGALSIDLKKTAQTIDDAKSDANMYTPKNLKADALPDGWAVTYDNTGTAGANFFALVQRTIDGKVYLCQTTTDSAERAQSALAACKTLRK